MLWDADWDIYLGEYGIIPKARILVDIIPDWIKLEFPSSNSEVKIAAWSGDGGYNYRTNQILKDRVKIWDIRPLFQAPGIGYPETLFFHKASSQKYEIWSGDGTYQCDRLGSLSLVQLSTQVRNIDPLPVVKPICTTPSYGLSLYSYLFELGLAIPATISEDPAPEKYSVFEGIAVGTGFTYFQDLAINMIDRVPFFDTQPISFHEFDILNPGDLRSSINSVLKDRCFRFLIIQEGKIEIDLRWLVEYRVRSGFRPYGVRLELDSNLDLKRIWIPREQKDHLEEFLEVPLDDPFGLRQTLGTLVAATVMIKHLAQCHLLAANQLALEYDLRADSDAEVMRLFCLNSIDLASKSTFLTRQRGFFDRAFGFVYSDLVRLIEDSRNKPLWGNLVSRSYSDVLTHLNQLKEHINLPTIQALIDYHEQIHSLLRQTTKNVDLNQTVLVVIGSLCHAFENKSVQNLVTRIWEIGTTRMGEHDFRYGRLGYLATTYQTFMLGSDYDIHFEEFPEIGRIVSNILTGPEMYRILKVFDLSPGTVTISPDM